MPSRARLRIKILQVGALALLLAACQSQGPAPLAPTPTNSPAPVNAATPTIVTAPAAEAAASSYMEALKNRDYDKATAAISDFSLSVFNSTRAAVRSGMDQTDKNGYRTLDYRVLDSRLLNQQTALVRVTVKTQLGTQAPDTPTIWIPLRLENNQWRVNAGLSDGTKVIDNIQLSLQPQTLNEVAIQPVRLLWLTTGIKIFLNIDNTSNSKRVALWAYGKEPFATIHFNKTNDNVNGTGTGITFLTGQKYANISIDIPGFYINYPDSIDLLNWQWATPATPPAPDTSVPKWSYTFKLH